MVTFLVVSFPKCQGHVGESEVNQGGCALGAWTQHLAIGIHLGKNNSFKKIKK